MRYLLYNLSARQALALVNTVIGCIIHHTGTTTGTYKDYSHNPHSKIVWITSLLLIKSHIFNYCAPKAIDSFRANLQPPQPPTNLQLLQQKNRTRSDVMEQTEDRTSDLLYSEPQRIQWDINY